jgi:hypothetical protein
MGLRTVQMSLKANQDALRTHCMMITNHRNHNTQK